MALDIALDPNNTGMLAHYWRITQTHLDHAQGQVTVWLHGWRDAAARLEGRAAAGGFSLVLHAEHLGDDLHQVTTSTLYNALKTRAAAAAAETDQALHHAATTIGHAILATAQDC